MTKTSPSISLRAPLGIGVLALCASLGLAGGAQAQDLGLGNRLDRNAPAPIAPVPGKESTLTGREDLVILDARKLFTAYFGSNAGYTSNAQSSSGGTGDAFVGANMGLHFETEIAEKWGIFADVSVFGSRYATQKSLDYSGFGASIGATMDTDMAKLGLYYAPQIVFDADFSTRLVTLHRFAVTATRSLTVAPGVVMSPTAALSLIATDPSDYARLSADISAPITYKPAAGWTFSATPSVSISVYPDFFESVTKVKRQDYSAGLELAAEYAINDSVAVKAALGFDYHGSTVSSLNYSAVNASPSLSLVGRF